MDDRDETIDRLRTKVGELTRDADLLQAKIERLEVGGGLEAGRGAIIRSGGSNEGREGPEGSEAMSAVLSISAGRLAASCGCAG